MNAESTNSKEGWIVGIIIGCVLLGCLAVLWLFVFKTASTRRGDNESAALRMREFREAAQSDQNLGLSERFGKTREEWAKSAATLKGDNQKVAAAISATFDELTPKVEGYDKAFKAVAEAGYAVPSFENVEEIQKRETLIADFQVRNAELLQGFEQVGAGLKTKLDASGVRDDFAEQEIRSFLSGLNVDEIRQLRKLDDVLAGIMLKQLALFRTEWGRWSVTEDGVVKFEDAAQQQAFEASQAEFQAAGEKQQRLLSGRP